MQSNSVSLMGGKKLYVRIPENIHELTMMEIGLPISCAGKTLMITVIDNDKAPFERDAIFERTDSEDLTYIGSQDYWEQELVTRVVVDGHPNCDFLECNSDCHVVSCSVHQGYTPCEPKEIAYLRSNKLK